MLFKRTTYKTLDDEALVALYKKTGRMAVVGELYERYGHLVLGVCMKYLKNFNDAEDTTMYVFEQLPEKLERHEIHYFKSWLYSVARNECLMILRKKGIVQLSEMTDHPGEVIDDERIVLEENLELLEQAINQLKTDQRTCITLFYMQEKGYKEISSLTGMDLSKVKSAIQNGKRNLKLFLTP